MKSYCTVITMILALVWSTAPSAQARDHLNTGEVIALAATPTVSILLGHHRQQAARNLPPRWLDPPGLDLWVATHLAPTPRAGRSNFMDTTLANELNTAVMGLAVGWLDGRYPQNDATQDVLQGQLLYWSGLVTLKGLQGGVKSAVGRQRPLPRLWPEVAAQRAHSDPGHDRSSFWSGHTSGAFYGATFLNLRLRGVLRRELDAAAYRDWSWVSPTVLFGWAAWVGYSRIHAHQHYLTDVLAGAAMGYAFATVFAALDPRGAGGRAHHDSGNPPPLVTVVLRF
jgi:hypothetical protein